MDAKSVLLTALVLIGVSSAASISHADETPEFLAPSSIQYYQGRYALPDVYQKLVDNYGNGFDSLYGTRNVRAVLSGLVYRGGANNAYNKNGKRNNENPLPNEGLQNLCEEGFGNAVYLYATNFQTAPKSVNCTTRTGAANHLTYASIPPLSSEKSARAILTMIQKNLSAGDLRPTYLHCWNGWHASGYISALTLRQFCGWTGDAAVAYWNRNTDGNYNGYDSIRNAIKAFVPDAHLSLPADIQSMVCPR